jgi:hypothetical protein
VRRRARPAPGFPPELADFAPAHWVDRYQWALARWEWWVAHPELHQVVDPIGLLRERRAARLGLSGAA